MNNYATQGTARDTISGTMLAVSANIGSHDFFRTIILAALGAAVSFGVSLFLKWLVRKRKR
jgi:hypothetical protein